MITRYGVQVNGEGRGAEAAREALRGIPSLEAEVKALLAPTDDDMQVWLEAQPEPTREEYRARVERLRKTNIDEPEAVALRTTYQDHNSTLPERLRPIIGKPKRGGDVIGACLE